MRFERPDVDERGSHGAAARMVPVVLALCLLVLAAPQRLAAQYEKPPPAAAYGLEGVTVVRADGTTLEDVNIVVRNGRIAALGSDVEVPASARLLEGDSLRVYPGMVDASGSAEYELPDQFTLNPTAQRYEPGTRDAASIVGIVAALDFLGEVGMESVGARGQELARYLQDGLREIPGVTVLTPEAPDLSASITTYKTDRVPYDELFRFFLEQYDARTRVVTERGLDGLRISTHLFNSKEDCDLIVEGTREILKK